MRKREQKSRSSAWTTNIFKHTHTLTHTHAYTRAHTHTRTHKHTHTHTYTHAHTRTHNVLLNAAAQLHLRTLKR